MISVIIPCYNCESTIKRCLLSIFNQTFKNFQIICINDGSCDGTLNILKSLGNKIVLINQDNHGQGFARNVGVEHSKGEFICFVDSDDYLEPNYLEKLIKNIGDSDICVCGYNSIKHNKLISRSSFDNEVCEPNRFWELNFINPVLSVVPWNKLYRREVFDFINFPIDKYYEDEFFLTEVIKHCNKISIISDTLYNYVDNDKGTMHTNEVYRKLDRVEARNIRCNYFLDEGFIKFYKLTMRENLFLLLRIKDIAKKNKRYEYKQRISSLERDLKETILRSLNSNVHNNFEIYLFAKNRLFFNVIYFFRKIFRTLLGRNYENA